MFCSSLRKRPVWASLPATLLSVQDPKWKESKFESYDLQIPVPRGNNKGQIDLFKIILLSAHDIQPPTTAIARVEQLFHKMGGKDIGVVFLLQQINDPGINGTIVFMELQLQLRKLDIPILPLSTISNLQATLSAFQRQLFNSRSTACSVSRPNPAITLLPYCSNGPMPEHARNILSDICHSIPALAQAATTPDGQNSLRQWLFTSTPQVAEEVIEFWEQEIVVD